MRNRHEPREEEPTSMTELQTLMTGIVFGEQPRWHEDRLDLPRSAGQG